MNGFWSRVGEQLREPTGAGGRLIGWLMIWVNRGPNRAATAALALKGGETVLELGFGPGANMARILRDWRDVRICGVDQSAQMLAMATRGNQRAIRSGSLSLTLGHFSALPYGNGVFDRVLLVNSAYFLDGGGLAAAEIHRVLAEGGRVVAYVTEGATMAKWPFAGPETHRRFDRHSIVSAFVEGGFRRSESRVRQVRLGCGVTGFVAVIRKPVGRPADSLSPGTGPT